MSEAPTSAEVVMLDKRLEAAIRAVIEGMNLRKWAMEQALTVFATEDGPVVDPVDLAGKIYDFVATPALEALQPPAKTG